MLVNQKLDNSSYSLDFSDDFIVETFDFFTQKKQGNMEKYTYGISKNNDNTVSGLTNWNSLQSQNEYYLTKCDYAILEYVSTQISSSTVFSDIKCFIELGAGDVQAISRKTLPILRNIVNIEEYISVDIVTENNEGISRLVKEDFPKIKTSNISTDFFETAINVNTNGKTLMGMWGSSLCNLPGFPNECPKSMLTSKLINFANSLKAGDLFVSTVDTMDNEKKLIEAYSNEYVHGKQISILHRLQEYEIPLNGFDLGMWYYEPIWCPETLQLCASIFPIADHSFSLNDINISVFKDVPYVVSNCYKPKPTTLTECAKAAGFSKATCITQPGNPMVMLVAEK